MAPAQLVVFIEKHAGECTVPAKKIFSLTEYFYKEFKRKDFTIYVFYSAFNPYFVISPFELTTI